MISKKILLFPVAFLLTFGLFAFVFSHFHLTAEAQTPATIPFIHSNQSLVLSDKGIAKFNIVTKVGADQKIIDLANTLAEYLNKISGATFTVTTGDGSAGIVIGDADDFPILPIIDKFDLKDMARQDEYMMYTTQNGLYLIGATTLATEFAMWNFLSELGHRQFFPTATWEIIPTKSKIEAKLKRFETPGYVSRGAFYGGGDTVYNKANYESWRKKNRMFSSQSYPAGEVWWAIILDNDYYLDFGVDLTSSNIYTPTTATHPEYVAQTKPYSKLCVHEKGLQDIVFDWAKDYFLLYPDRKMISLARSDGDNDWAPCKNSASTGEDAESPADRQAFLANTIVKRLHSLSDPADPTYDPSLPDYSDKIATVQAYGSAATPPVIYDVDPSVAVTIASGFYPGDADWRSILEGWKSKGATQFAIYEYLEVFSWDFELPGKSRASKPLYLRDALFEYHDAGVTHFYGEMGDGWGLSGLGYWLTAHLLWRPEEGGQPVSMATFEKWKDTFFTKAFGTAEPAMREFYDLIDGEPYIPYLTPDLLGRMYLKLSEARSLTTDAGVLARISDLTLYARHLELYRKFTIDESTFNIKNASYLSLKATYDKLLKDYNAVPPIGTEQAVLDAEAAMNLALADPTRLDAEQVKLASYEAMFLHLYRMRKTEMVHYAAFFLADYGDDTAFLQTKYGLASLTDSSDNLPPPFSDVLFTDAEISGFITGGIANNPLKGFEDVTFSTDLMPATPLNLTYTGGSFTYLAGEQDWYVWVDESLLNATTGEYEFKINFTAGRTSKANPASLTIDLFAPGDDESSIQTETVPPNKVMIDSNGDGTLDKTTYPVATVTLASPVTGLHRLHLDDSSDQATIDWAIHQPLKISKIATEADPPKFNPSYTMLFYVPKGTKTVGGLAQSTISAKPKMQYYDGKVWLDAVIFAPGLNHFKYDVPLGQDGKLWKFTNCLGVCTLATVPPQLSKIGAELLLPFEVVEADAP